MLAGGGRLIFAAFLAVAAVTTVLLVQDGYFDQREVSISALVQQNLNDLKQVDWHLEALAATTNTSSSNSTTSSSAASSNSSSSAASSSSSADLTAVAKKLADVTKRLAAVVDTHESLTKSLSDALSGASASSASSSTTTTSSDPLTSAVGELAKVTDRLEAASAKHKAVTAQVVNLIKSNKEGSLTPTKQNSLLTLVGRVVAHLDRSKRRGAGRLSRQLKRFASGITLRRRRKKSRRKIRRRMRRRLRKRLRRRRRRKRRELRLRKRMEKLKRRVRRRNRRLRRLARAQARTARRRARRGRSSRRRSRGRRRSRRGRRGRRRIRRAHRRLSRQLEVALRKFRTEIGV